MATASSSSSAVRRRGPYIPTIGCPDCGKMVMRSVSGTPDHNGWTFYKCRNHGHGCVFWHWELEYVGYLVKNSILRGDVAVDALGWAEDRREELELRQAERVATGDGGAGAKQQKLMKKIEETVDALKQVIRLLNIGLGLVGLLCCIILLKK